MRASGLTIAFLGPDGSGKSTIIEGILKQGLPFGRHDYFHLKPILPKDDESFKVVIDPHKYPVYNRAKSYSKLLFFILQYNFGWLKNIVPLKKKSSLIIFDRYYDDLLVDYKRYRYGSNLKIAKFILNFIPKPDLYFILSTDANIIYKRKKEVPLPELQRQITGYQSLGDNTRYFNIDVNRTPEQIVIEIRNIIMRRIHDR